MQEKIENEFGKFFYTQQYMKLKNYLFNYRMRKLMIKRAFNKFVGPHNLGNSFLVDIGSGISPITPFPKETLFMELEEKAVAFLKKQGFSAVKADITNLPLKPGTVDAIFCSEVLEHVPDYEKALRECSKSLKQSGKLFVTVPIHMKYWHEDDDFVGHIRRFNPDQLASDMEDAGLKVLEVKPIGSRLERFLTRYIVKVARKSGKEFSSNIVKDYSFFLINTILFGLAYIAYLFNSKKSSSIILISAEKL